MLSISADSDTVPLEMNESPKLHSFLYHWAKALSWRIPTFGFLQPANLARWRSTDREPYSVCSGGIRCRTGTLLVPCWSGKSHIIFYEHFSKEELGLPLRRVKRLGTGIKSHFCQIRNRWIWALSYKVEELWVYKRFISCEPFANYTRIHDRSASPFAKQSRWKVMWKLFGIEGIDEGWSVRRTWRCENQNTWSVGKRCWAVTYVADATEVSFWEDFVWKQGSFKQCFAICHQLLEETCSSHKPELSNPSGCETRPRR